MLSLFKFLTSNISKTIMRHFLLNFSPTLYVGEHQHGLYAMPSLVDKQTLTITPRRSGPSLLEGPKDYDVSKKTCRFLDLIYVVEIGFRNY